MPPIAEKIERLQYNIATIIPIGKPTKPLINKQFLTKRKIAARYKVVPLDTTSFVSNFSGGVLFNMSKSRPKPAPGILNL